MTLQKLLAPLFFLAFTLCMVPACKDSANNGQQENTSDTPPADDSQHILDKKTFATQIRKSGTVVLDVRFPADFEKGHLEDAININFFDPDFKYKLLELNKKKKYFIYGKTEATAYRAMKFMEDNGFTQVYILKDGYEKWDSPPEE